VLSAIQKTELQNTLKKIFSPRESDQGRLIPRNDQTSNSGYESSVRLVSVSAQKKPTSAEIASNQEQKRQASRRATEEFPQQAEQHKCHLQQLPAKIRVLKG
jgi:hypothetical protein